MKSYPSIDGASRAPREPCIAFVKYDGTNFRAEWSSKRGWYKYGLRTRLVDETDPIYGRAIPIFLEKYGDGLEKVFKRHKQLRLVKNIVVFGEFFGSKSFSGAHRPWDKSWSVVLFDVNPVKKGFMSPKEFLDEFGHLNVAEEVYRGNLNQPLIEGVRNSTIDFESKYDIRTEVPEGVVCKGGSGHKLWMCKIKSNTYREALKERYEGDWEKYWE